VTLERFSMMESEYRCISEEKAIEIARRFLQQHHSVSVIENIVLEGNVWKITLLVSSFGSQIKEVEINATTGNIIEWHEIYCQNNCVLIE
jgi:uncharacterized membrane protein YkoI